MTILKKYPVNEFSDEIKLIFKNKKRIVFYVTLCLCYFLLNETFQYKFYMYKLTTALNNNDITGFNYAVNNKPANLFINDNLDQKLNDIYKDYLEGCLNKYKNKSLTDDSYIANLTKIKSVAYLSNDLLNTYFQKSEKVSTSNNNYNKACSLLSEKNYVEAYKLFSTVLPTSSEYNIAVTKIEECSDLIKDATFVQVDKLIDKKLFDDAKTLLEENSTYFALNDENEKKSDEIQQKKESYFNSLDSKPTVKVSTSSEITNLSAINSKSINTLKISSETKYLIYVSTSEQKTYIFAGSANKWNIYKTFICSTGISEQPTPLGVFKIHMRGDWFFAEKYKQGAKYWTAFKGTNYLFHSVPYDRTATNIVDTTMGKPASHGCIRLNTQDAEWLHDNIPDDTQVIIN